MSLQLNQQAEAIFHEAIALPESSRAEFLLRRLRGDPELRALIQELVEAHERLDRGDAHWLGAAGTSGSRSADSAIAHREIQSSQGRYRLLDVLGEGGMGIVYLAEQLEPIRRRVALKVVKLEGHSRHDRARFAAERQALALMNHPNIARVYEAGTTDDGRLYFALELVRGRSLLEFCDAARLSLNERLDLLIAVCHAVQHAHQNGVIHRDIKPSNILVQSDGKDAVPKLIDFGVAKSLQHRLAEESIYTQRGLLVGSLEYMSPEQAAGDCSDLDTRTDIYSLGVVLHELVTGVRPSPEGGGGAAPLGRMELLAAGHEMTLASRRVVAPGVDTATHARLRGTDPAGLVKQLRNDLDWIIAKALETDRMRRYPSASELAGDLERYRRNEPVLAGPPDARYRLGKLARRHRGLIAAISLAMLSLAMGLVMSTGLYMQVRRANQRLEEQRAHIQLSSDAYLLEVLTERAEALVPGLPGQIPALEGWLAEAEATVLRRLPEHRQRLQSLEAMAASGRRPTEPEIVASPQERRGALDREVLSDLVPALERFAGPEGTCSDVRRRLAFARGVRAASLESPRAAWDAAIAAVADPAACPAYSGMRITPQLGLIPIGRDPRSGLWEFAHLQSGAPARRDPAGKLVVTDSTGIVLVLVPGGSFFMGATRDPKALPPGAHNLDPNARDNEGPVRQVQLDPFFISKYEVTQGQWLHLMHENPSECAAGSRLDRMRYVHTLVHPVERVNHASATRAAARMGLELPTEAQWEYAARAGTMTIAYEGKPSDMKGYLNGADRASLHYLQRDWDYSPWDDGYAKSSPVGSFLPNRFGLHDVQGNVCEWCRDAYAADAYSAPLLNGAGERAAGPADSYPYFVSRGGPWDHQPVHARISWRIDLPAYNEERLGLRPSRRLER